VFDGRASVSSSACLAFAGTARSERTEAREMFPQVVSDVDTFSRDAVQCAKRKLKETIFCNINREIKFCTLTFDDEHLPEDFPSALKYAQLAMKRLQYFFDKSKGKTRDERHTVKYILVPELGGKTQRLHFHAILICPFLPSDVLAREIWQAGFCSVKSIKHKNQEKLSKAVANYISKYINKDCQKLAGRKRIYYASHNWKTTKARATLSNRQARRLLSFLSYAVSENVIKKPQIYFRNYDCSTPSPDLVEKYSASLSFPSVLDNQPADIISYTFTLPTSYAETFLDFCHAQKVDFISSSILSRTPEERARSERCKTLATLFINCAYDKRAILPAVETCCNLFPRVPAFYIYTVFQHQYVHRENSYLLNNFDIMDKFADDFDFSRGTCDVKMRALAFCKLGFNADFNAINRFQFLPKMRINAILAG
jgi:hypothetical protein